MIQNARAKNIVTNEINKKVRKIAFSLLKPFLPFIILIVGIIFAICTVIDGIFVTEADMSLVEKAERGELTDEEYMQWLQSRTENPTVLPEGDGLVSKGMFIWPIPGYTKITSHFGMRVHPITRSL